MAWNSLARVTFQDGAGLPEDAVVMSFAFTGAAGSLTVSDTDEIETALVEFFNTNTAAGDNVAEFLGSRLSRAAGASTIEHYDLGEPVSLPLGSPIKTDTFTLAAIGTGSTQLPDDVAVALSFHANLTDVPEEVGNTRPAARRRGRIYFGPLHSSASDQGSTSTPAMVSTAFRTTLAQAAARLKIYAFTEAQWGVWSRVDGVVRPVVGGFVDNAFDTVRSRGRKATTRLTWT